jgi:glycosyltransferase involved in cell wall biosynthesis
MRNNAADKPIILAITDWGAGHVENGSQVLARAILARLEEWFDVYVWVPEGAAGGARVREIPASFDTRDEATAELPPVSVIYNFGGTSFSCRASDWVSRSLPTVPLVNHFQLNLGCYARHQELDAAQVHSLTLEQAHIAARAARNLFPSHSELALAAELFGSTAADYYVVPNAFVPDGEPEPEDESATFTFFAAGRFSDAVKGADLLYRAFADLIERGTAARLEIASDSDRFLSLLRGVPADAWLLHPWLPRRRLHARMRATDVVVVPSRYEPFGLVAIEALCMGTPVIATGVGGLQEVVHHGVTGWLSAPREGSRGLREAMECAVAAGPRAVRAMGETAARVARREYSLERIAWMIRTHLDNARHHEASRMTQLAAAPTWSTSLRAISGVR